MNNFSACIVAQDRLKLHTEDVRKYKYIEVSRFLAYYSQVRLLLA